MPLDHSKSPGAFKTNVRTLMHDVGKSPHVQSREQALAIAYSTARRAGVKKADGGKVQTKPPPRFSDFRRSENIEDRREVDNSQPATSYDYTPPATKPSAMARDLGLNAIGKAEGGGFAPTYGEKTIARQVAPHSGFLHSTVPGRTDKLPISVSGGAYVLPADHLAALGQGNSLAGANIVNKMFKMGPYGSAQTPIHAAAKAPGAHLNLTPKPLLSHLQKGGGGHVAGQPTQIIAAGGETVIPPDKIIAKFGSLKKGHAALDQWVVDTREEHAKTLKHLKPPRTN
jgi:hypothetical protein